MTEKDSLKQMLAQGHFQYSAAISMQWVLFGSAGHKEMPAEGQLKGFNKCTGKLSKQMKCLGSTFWFHHHATFRPTHVHQCNFQYAQNPAKTMLLKCILYRVSSDPSFSVAHVCQTSNLISRVLHACMKQLEKSIDQKYQVQVSCRHGAVAVLGNGNPLFMNRYKIMPGNGEQANSVSYRAHLDPGVHKHNTNITPAHEVVLFHYVTRSQNAFVERKINRRSGIYATTYSELRAKDKTAGELLFCYCSR